MIESCKERIEVEVFEVVMENLRTFTNTKVCICDKSYLMPCHIFVSTPHQNYNRSPLVCQGTVRGLVPLYLEENPIVTNF